MTGTTGRRNRVGAAMAVPMLALIVVPIIALALATSPGDLAAGLSHPLFAGALMLSALTSAMSLGLIVLFGTPLAWWLARSGSPHVRWVEAVVDLPILLPPAVVGIGLLMAFGANGVLAPAGGGIAFTTAAVVVAQTVVGAPFYVQSATAAFRGVDPGQLVVARTLGSGRAGAFFRVALPLATPGLLGGAAVAWARALGEFGATLLFAGNLAGSTQTAPLAIYSSLETDVRVAVALSLVMAALAVVLLLGMRALRRTR